MRVPWWVFILLKLISVPGNLEDFKNGWADVDT